MDIELILSMYEDDYNPSSTVPKPRKMYAGGVATPKRGLVDEPGSYAGRYADPDYQKKWYEKNKERLSKEAKEKYRTLPLEEKKEKIRKGVERQKTEENKEKRRKQFKEKKLAKDPLSPVDKKLLNRFKLNLTYSKIVNEIIKDHGGLRPKPETLSELIDIHYDIDPEFQKAWKQVAGDAPFSSRNLSPSSLKFNYNRAMEATKKVTAENFKKELESLIKSELKGTGTTYDEFIENNLRLNETYLTDNYKSKTKGALYQRRYKKVMQSGVGWNPEGAGAKVFFGDPQLKTSTIPTKLNERLGTKGFDDAGKFVRAHYFGTIQAKKLYDLGLLNEEAAKNFKERYTWKPNYINVLQGSTYDADVYKAILKYNKHKDKSLLAKDLNLAAKNAKKLGLDVDELAFDNKTKKFNFLDKGRVFQKGGDRELRYLSKNAINEIANVQALSGKALTSAAETDIKQAYGNRANRIIKQIQVGIDYNYSNLDKSMLRAIDRIEPIKFNKLLGQFEARGCGKAAGGRILFSNGSSGGTMTRCAQKGVQGFINDLKKGNYSKATKDILKGGGQFLKGALNPMDMLKLRNLLGPTAMGFLAAFEGGVITDDVIRQGTPLNESLADNWLTRSFLPYTQEYAKAKNLLETGKVPSNMKKYVKDVMTFNDALKDVRAMESNVESRIADLGGYGMIDGTSVYTQEQEDKDRANIMKKLSPITEEVATPGSAKALEMKSLQDENEATRMAKKEFKPFFGFDKLEDVRTQAPTPGIEDYMYVPEEVSKDLRPITYQDYERTELPDVERQYYEKKYNISPGSSLSDYSFPGSNTNALKELTNRYNISQASNYPGYYGANEKFMEGGIASLNVKKK